MAEQKTADASGEAAVYYPIAKLKPWADNPRDNAENVARVARSISRFGFSAPVVARKADSEIIAGHTRVLAAESLGLAEVPVRFLDISTHDAHALALADNRLNELAPWKTDELLAQLNEIGLPDAEVAGWSSEDLDKLAADLVGSEPDDSGSVDEDEAPEPPADPVTKPGDVWTLGKHRLVCGDCRDPAVVAALVQGQPVNVAFTSPPYASQRKYDESSGFKPIPPDAYCDWFEAVQANVREHLAPDGSWFVNIKAHCQDGQRHLYVADLLLAHVRSWGWRFVDELAWLRRSHPGAWPNRFKNGWEPVFHFCSQSAIEFNPSDVGHESRHCIAESRQSEAGRAFTAGAGAADGIALPSNVVEVEIVGGKSHPAVFPVGLPSFFIKAYSDEGDRIFDPFMGSGTTLIASEQNGRIGLGTEISPAYCDVVVARWESLTGGKATRVQS